MDLFTNLFWIVVVCSCTSIYCWLHITMRKFLYFESCVYKSNIVGTGRTENPNPIRQTLTGHDQLKQSTPYSSSEAKYPSSSTLHQVRTFPSMLLNQSKQSVMCMCQRSHIDILKMFIDHTRKHPNFAKEKKKGLQSVSNGSYLSAFFIQLTITSAE